MLLAGLAVIIPIVAFISFHVLKPLLFGFSIIGFFIIALAVVLAFFWIYTLFYILKLNDIELV